MNFKATTCEWMRRWSLVLTIATFLFFWFSTYPAAKSGLGLRDLSEAGVALWIFLILGAIIILLQLVPAIIMFFGLVGTGTHAITTNEAKETKEVKEVDEELWGHGI